jgi:hypothetical protein
MEVLATRNNLINLISSLLIRLRNKKVNKDSEIINDLNTLVDYLSKITNETGKETALYDKNFITSNDDLNELSNSIANYSSDNIRNFKKIIPKENSAFKKKNIEEVKEHLRKVAGVFISYNNSN